MSERFEDRSNLDQLRDLQQELDTTEKKLIERDALLAAIVQNAHDAIIARDLESTIIVWNAAAERMYGWKAGEVIGKKIYIIIPDDRLTEHAEVIERAKRGESSGPFKTQRKTKDGRLVNIILSVSPIIARSGEVLGASAIEHEDFGNE